MKKKLKKIPFFKNEDEERDFWATHDTTEYFDWSKAIKVSFPNLKFSSSSVTMRMPLILINDLKRHANQKDVPYQSLVKIWLWEKIREEDRRNMKAKILQ